MSEASDWRKMGGVSGGVEEEKPGSEAEQEVEDEKREETPFRKHPNAKVM